MGPSLVTRVPPSLRRGNDPRATQLVELAEGVELFHAPDGTAYARIEQGDHREVWPLKSGAIRSWLAGTYYRRHERAAGGQAIRDAVEVLAARALFDGRECAVYVRVARTTDAIYLDLADPKWRAVKITASGWEIVTDSPICFRRPDGVLHLPDPVRGGSIQELRPFLNVADDSQWRLAVGWLVAAIRGAGPYPVLDIQGEQGSAKSSTARAQRRVIDPNASPDRAAPRNEHDLAIAAQNSLVVSLDNVSKLPDWLSDALARLATGAGFAARMLYSDGEEKLFYGARPIIINAIGDVVTRSDLLDRSLVLELPRIADQSRRTEEEFWADFDVAHPRILGALLDAVAGALARRPSIRLERLPRMADFATWAVAAEPALGWPDGAFMRAYAGNRASAHELALEAVVGRFAGPSTRERRRLAGHVHRTPGAADIHRRRECHPSQGLACRSPGSVPGTGPPGPEPACRRDWVRTKADREAAAHLPHGPAIQRQQRQQRRTPS